MRAPTLGDQVYLGEADEAFGSVRLVHASSLVVYVEGAGDFTVPVQAVKSVHDGKVVLHSDRLEPALQVAISRAHAKEEPARRR
jgi:hypothetical protein